MKKTTKIIDLLVTIANEGEVPEKIEYDGKVMIYDHNKQDYKGYYSNGNGDWLFQFLFDKCRNTENFINDEVEILDEKEFEDIEELNIEVNGMNRNERCIIKGDNKILNLSVPDYELAIKIKQLIKNQKKIINIIKNSNLQK